MTEAYGSSTAHTLVNTSLLSSPRATLASCSTLASLGQHRSITGTAKHTPGNGSAPRCSHTRLRPRHTRQATYPSFGSCSVAERLASWGAAFSQSRKACAEHWLRTQVQGRFLRAHYTGLVRCCLPARQSRRSHPSTVVGSAARAPFLPFLTAKRRCYVTPYTQFICRGGTQWPPFVLRLQVLSMRCEVARVAPVRPASRGPASVPGHRRVYVAVCAHVYVGVCAQQRDTRWPKLRGRKARDSDKFRHSIHLL